ncbi:6-phosphogluconate dehydrogenase family protein isoform 1 [Hibiscus syriacus]|uniref:6-phosphogluconate dehydrogenase family protein isoform 1 n=1 Tax=Hibiscus syriacus TaxID=106335 RepID=A0A6A2Y9R0_HIBSY|nr:6-phosphogluconate dehydrogenase family protein isoform 1 [Hibiscus syriacus]
MEVSIARIRSRTLWKQGANLSSFRIMSHTVLIPHIQRLAIVNENLRNRSSLLYFRLLIDHSCGYFVFVSIKLLKTKRNQAMERQADEGEILNNRWADRPPEVNTVAPSFVHPKPE